MWAVIEHMKYHSVGWDPGGVDPEWRTVNREDVSRAVIKPIATDKTEDHVKEAVVAVKAEGPRSSIFVAHHHPRGKGVAGGKNRLGGNDRLGYIGAKESDLPVDQPIQDCQREEPLFCAAVVDGDFSVFNGNCNGEWWDINQADKKA
jgi:hypothetical protein